MKPRVMSNPRVINQLGVWQSLKGVKPCEILLYKSVFEGAACPLMERDDLCKSPEERLGYH